MAIINRILYASVFVALAAASGAAFLSLRSYAGQAYVAEARDEGLAVDPEVVARFATPVEEPSSSLAACTSFATEAVRTVQLMHLDAQDLDGDFDAWAAAVGATGLTLDPSAGPHTVVDAVEKGLDMRSFASHRNPGAGMIGTASDLLGIGSALLRIGQGEAGGIVQPATLAMMLRPFTGDIPRLEPYLAERGQDWGFTFNLRTRAPGLIDRDVYGHGGWAGTEFWIHPSAGVAFVLMTNRNERPGVDLDELDNAVISAL